MANYKMAWQFYVLFNSILVILSTSGQWEGDDERLSME